MNSDDVRRTHTKTCSKCLLDKSLEDFHNYKHELRCKTCISKIRKEAYARDREKVLARVTKYRRQNPEKIRDTKLKQAYGVGIDYFNAKLKEQNGVCAGCSRDFKSEWRGRKVNMCLDHNHSTNKPRGILCIKCNRALGLFEENRKTLNNIVEYLDKYEKSG
jgi:Recombination endonuclease VII